MIYTIGKRDVYDRYIANDPDAAKAKGGSVWQTQKTAEAYLDPGFAVYGVEAKWDVDTRPDFFGVGSFPWHELIRPAKLIKL